MDKKLEKVVWVVGSVALTVVAFYFLPEIQRKMTNMLYRKMK